MPRQCKYFTFTTFFEPGKENASHVDDLQFKYKLSVELKEMNLEERGNSSLTLLLNKHQCSLTHSFVPRLGTRQRKCNRLTSITSQLFQTIRLENSKCSESLLEKNRILMTNLP